MAISLRMKKEDEALVKQYAALHGISCSELIRQAVMERIENEFDLALFDKAMEEYLADPETYTLEEVEKELGLK